MGSVCNLGEVEKYIGKIEALFNEGELDRIERILIIDTVKHRIMNVQQKEKVNDLLGSGWIGKMLNPMKKDTEKDEGEL